MDKNIPEHHTKQQICVTRPAYREGRIPKAVKVYTINNESKYILIQGVPSVGATKELIKLCASYGQVEEHHALDEYPCEDQYTEVYIVKYGKIQAARFAKRKLDDYSFFGGNLHVCYAPEYESVKETREKLLDRRKIIASKIRRHQSEAQNAKTTEPAWQYKDDITPPMPSTSVSENVSSQFHQHIPDSLGASDQHGQDLSQPESSQSQLPGNERDDSSMNFSHGPYSFILPPPPKHSSMIRNVETKSKYEYSLVPSKHSTLPDNFDGRLLDHGHPQGKDLVSATPSQSTGLVETSISKEPVQIKKDYTSQKQALRFVPRQAVKRKPDESGCGESNSASSSSEVDGKIRKNAFILGDQQGPADFPGRRNKLPEITPGASKSYNDTIKTIRCKISQVITDSLVPKK